MSGKELLQAMVRSFFVIVTGTVFASALFNSFFIPTRYISSVQLWEMLVLGAASTLPHLIFYSKKELSKRSWRVRQGVHGVVLFSLLVGLAVYWGWIVFSLRDLFFFLLMGAAIYFLVRLVGFQRDSHIAKQMNSGLERLRKK